MFEFLAPFFDGFLKKAGDGLAGRMLRSKAVSNGMHTLGKVSKKTWWLVGITVICVVSVFLANLYPETVRSALRTPLDRLEDFVWILRGRPGDIEEVRFTSASGDHYLALGKNELAREKYRRAVSLMCAMGKREDPFTGDLLRAEAGACSCLQDFASAHNLLLDALNIHEAALGFENQATALDQRDLANIYRSTKAYVASREMYSKALASLKYKEGTEPSDFLVATTLYELAGLYREEEKYADAEKTYLLAQRGIEKFLKPTDPQLPLSKLGLAHVYFKQGRFSDAEAIYKECLSNSILSQIGSNHALVGAALKEYAELLQKTGRQVEADQFRSRASEIFSK
jgi:tetratricopeptide (TPR) repeat protein